MAAERALDHMIGKKVQQAYLRTDLFEQRQAVAELWAARLLSGRDNTACVPAYLSLSWPWFEKGLYHANNHRDVPLMSEPKPIQPVPVLKGISKHSGLTRAPVDRWWKANLIESVELGRSRLVFVASVDAYLDRKRHSHG
jgi:hypothetical protein